MSIVTDIVEKGLGTVIKSLIGGIPSLYLWGAGLLALGGAVTAADIYWHHVVDKAVNAKIAVYIAQREKDDKDLAAIDVRDNTKILIQYVDRVKVITKVVHDNATVAQNVPDANVVLSMGWVNNYNDTVAGVSITPADDTNKTPSGVTSGDALAVIDNNTGTCLVYKEQIDGLQQWITDKQTEIAALNKKNGVK